MMKKQSIKTTQTNSPWRTDPCAKAYFKVRQSVLLNAPRRTSKFVKENWDKHQGLF